MTQNPAKPRRKSHPAPKPPDLPPVTASDPKECRSCPAPPEAPALGDALGEKRHSKASGHPKTPPRSAATRPGFHAGRSPANKGQTYPAEILTPQEALALVQACSATAPTGIRNRALIVVLWRAGLRLGEALALRPKDVDLRRGTVTVLHGKGDRRRTVGLDPEAQAVVAHWLERRGRLGFARAPVFCTLEGRPLKPSYVRTLFPRLGVKAGIEKRVHPHGLRHTHAVELATEGVPMNLIQAQLGHSSLATTDRYLRHLAPMELVKAMQRRTWAKGD